MDATTSVSTKPLYRGTQIVWFILGLIEVLPAFRFVLKLLGANASAGFTSFIYSVTNPLTAPFAAVFRVSKTQGSIFEWTTILTMFVYLVIAWGIVKLLAMSMSVSTPEAAVKLNQENS